MSPFILCLHPDTCRHFSAEHAASNENTLKQLNSFIAIASLGCNSDIQTLQKRLQTDSFLRNQNIMRFPLAFYVSESNGNETSSASQCIRYTINIPSSLLRHTLAADTVQSIHSLADNWRRITKRILSDLSIVTKIPFAELSQLQFECEESPDFAQLGSISRYNRRQFRQHQRFQKDFDKVLRREKSLMHPKVTGREDVPLHNHSILHSLLSERVRIEKQVVISSESIEREHHYRVFAWIANTLLIHFEQLGLHRLVWNKISLLVMCRNESIRHGIPQIVYNERNPRQGMTLLLPFEMETTQLIEFLSKQSHILAKALESKSLIAPKTSKWNQ